MKENNRIIYVILLALVCWLTYLTTNMISDHQASKQTEITNIYNVSGFSTDLSRVVEECNSSIVTIKCGDSILSGIVYRQDGDKVYIVTALHGIGTEDISVIFKTSYAVSASLVGKDIYADVAVLEVVTPYEIKPLEVGNSSLLKEGEFVVCIGTPRSLDYAGSAELGMISHPRRTISNSIIFEGNSYAYFLDVVQLSANLRPGFSGSPLLNMDGELVGMTTMSIDGDVVFAIGANEIRMIADGIIEGNGIHKVQLGIKGLYVGDMHNYEKTSLNLPIDTLNGLYVEKLKENALAYIAGVRSGDVILSINGIEINGSDDYLKAVYTAEKSFEFLVSRAGESYKLTGTIND